MAGKCTSQMEVKHHYRNILTQCVSQEVQITGDLNIPRSMVTAKALHRIQMGQHTQNQNFNSLHTLFREYGCEAGSSGLKEKSAEQESQNPCPYRDLTPLGRHNSKVDTMLSGNGCKGQKYDRGPGTGGIGECFNSKVR